MLPCLAKMSTIVAIVSLLVIISYLLYLLAQKKFDYWEKKNVPYLKPLPLLGNYGKYILLQEYPGQVVQKLCQQFSNKPYFGAFFGTEPVLVVLSPELLKHIFTKDFYYFNGREVSNYNNKEVFTRSLFFTSGDRWKVLRHNLTHLFTSAKMKNMFHLIEKYSHIFEDTLEREIGETKVIEAKDISARFTMDCICSCAFGVESNTMIDPDNNVFKFMADEIFRSTHYRGFKIVFRAIWPAIFYRLGFKCFPETIDQFFFKLLKGVFESRNYEPSSRNDFIDLLLTLKKENKVLSSASMNNFKTGLDECVHLKLDDEVLVGQCIAFFAAGFETSASTLSFTLYELAKNPEVQERAVKEVDDYLRRNRNKLTYDCIKELPFLDACVYESLRKYPVLGYLTREVMDDFTFTDGLKLDKGVRIHIPTYSFHYSPDNFEDPDIYKPERFLPENKDKIKQYTFLPYGEGPRICIGKRFSKMQIMPGLVSILKRYRVELAEGMPETLVFDSKSLLIQPKDHGLMLKFCKREGWKQRTFIRS